MAAGDGALDKLSGRAVSDILTQNLPALTQLSPLARTLKLTRNPPTSSMHNYHIGAVL
jgi:hypothetical protein